MIELCSYALKACERPGDDFVYLAEEVDELIEQKDKRIVELNDLVDMIVNSESADKVFIPAFYKIFLHKAKQLNSK